MWPKPQFAADLVTFTEKSLMKNLNFVQCIISGNFAQLIIFLPKLSFRHLRCILFILKQFHISIYKSFAFLL